MENQKELITEMNTTVNKYLDILNKVEITQKAIDKIITCTRELKQKYKKNINRNEELKFKKLYDHILYLAELYNVYVIDNTIYINGKYGDRIKMQKIEDGRKLSMFHGTSIEALKHILNDGFIRGCRLDISNEDYGKVFFTDRFGLANIFALMGGSESSGFIGEDTCCILEFNLKNYDVWTFRDIDFIVYGDISINTISKVYIMDGRNIVNEYTIKELRGLSDGKIAEK